MGAALAWFAARYEDGAAPENFAEVQELVEFIGLRAPESAFTDHLNC